MLRSRGDRSGRFHKLSLIAICVYFSSAGETTRISSSVSAERGRFELGVALLDLRFSGYEGSFAGANSPYDFSSFLTIFSLPRGLGRDEEAAVGAPDIPLDCRYPPEFEQ